MSRPRLSVAIMAVPERAAGVAAIQAQLGEEVPVFYDPERSGPWATAKRAWLAHTGVYHVVLQDDLAVCRDFLLTVDRMVRLVPNACFSLFSTSGKGTRLADEAGASWYVRRDGPWGAAVVLPSAWIPAMVRYGDSRADLRHHDDRRLGSFLKRHHFLTFYPVPSVVEHLGDKSVLGHPSSIGGRPRRATRYVGDHVSGLVVDWRRGLPEPPVLC